MSFDIHNLWFLFCIGFGMMLLASYIMGRQGRSFITMDPIRRNVSMLSLEFPSKPMDLSNVMKGIYRLPDDEQKASIRSLRGQIIVDFLLFMPGTYGAIFILLMKMAMKMGPFGFYLFTVLAWAQILCFVLDAIENFYFLSQIKPDVKPSQTAFRMMQVLELMKWGFALLGAVCGFSAAAFFWLSGQYSADTLIYPAIFGGLIVVFLLVGGKKK